MDANICRNPLTQKDRSPMIHSSCTCRIDRRQPLDAIDVIRFQTIISHGKTRRREIFTLDGTSLGASLNSKCSDGGNLPVIPTDYSDDLLKFDLMVRAKWAPRIPSARASPYLFVIRSFSFETQDPNRPKRLRSTLMLHYLYSLRRRSITV
jgi:hypothetical protein